MNRPLIHTAAFDRAARRASRRNPAVAAAIAVALARPEADAFDPRLGTHKLPGDLADYWAASAGYDLRIVFRFIDVSGVATILLVTCGPTTRSTDPRPFTPAGRSVASGP